MPVKELSDGTKYTKATYYNDETLKGDWDIYIKLDGVRALRLDDGSVVSRDSKPLYNLDELEFNDAEIFSNNWNESVSLVRSKHPKTITQEMVYNLDPPDPRLRLSNQDSPDAEYLHKMMNVMLDNNHEGLVIRQGKKWLKVVPELQADVIVKGYKEGTGKNVGKLGSILTGYGSVGSGFTDEERTSLWANKESLVGKFIQVGYRELTTAKKFRFPKFQHFRFDKTEESF